jgi:hypothetical protein
MLQQFFNPAEIWVLAWGQMSGASGRGLHGQAAVYRVAPDGVNIEWSLKQDNMTAQKNELGWEVSYADHDLLYGNAPKPYFLDVYKMDFAKRTSTRIVHYQYSPN